MALAEVTTMSIQSPQTNMETPIASLLRDCSLYRALFGFHVSLRESIVKSPN